MGKCGGGGGLGRLVSFFEYGGGLFSMEGGPDDGAGGGLVVCGEGGGALHA